MERSIVLTCSNTHKSRPRKNEQRSFFHCFGCTSAVRKLLQSRMDESSNLPKDVASVKRQLSPAWALFILTGLNLFNYLVRSVLSAVLPNLQKDLGLDDNQGGTLGTAFMLGYFVTSPFFGFLG